MRVNYYEFVSFEQEALRYYPGLVALALGIGIAASLLSLAYLTKREERYARLSFYAALLLSAELTVLYLLLIRYHLGMAEVSFINPFEGGRFSILMPFWVEKERLLFWLWIYSFMVLYAWRYGEKAFASSLNLGSLAFLIAIFLTGREEPLPEMSALVKQYLLWEMHPFTAPLELFRSLMGKYYLYSTWYMWLHPPLIFIAYAAFTVNFFSCVAMLLRRDAVYDAIGYAYAKFGYLLLTLGLLIGYPWALEAWRGTSWWWSPIISASFMLWFFYSAYLHARLYIADRGMWRITAALGIAGYLSVIFAYLIIFLLPGVHAYV
ncbi:MAG: cytochrome c biogenesis protein CcsA [Euryarchaeota archaeon]|nr:cytochrome c biogenesis protein CcsA [Euryarchaeota archaeon]